MEPETDEEQKLLDILNETELPGAAGLMQAEEAVAAAFPEMDEVAQKAMARVIMSRMPSPEEIQKAEEIVLHNAEVQSKRDERISRRNERRQAKAEPNRRIK